MFSILCISLLKCKLSGRLGGLVRVEGLSIKEKEKKLMDTDNRMLIAKGGEWARVGEGMGGINGDGWRFDLG